MPCHSGICVNEVADELAGNGSFIPFDDPGPAIGILSSFIRNLFFVIFRVRVSDKLKSLIRIIQVFGISSFLKLNSNGIRKVIGLLTGHCPLRRHLTVMGFKNDPFYRGYDNKETTVSIFCTCES